MHEEKEQTQFVVMVGQIFIFGIFQRFFFLEKENNAEKSPLTVCHIGDIARVPLGYI